MQKIAIITQKNRIINSPHFDRIMREYNERLAQEGKVSEKKFFDEVISKIIPDYTLAGWYFFIRKFKSEVGTLDVKKPVSTEVVPLGVALPNSGAAKVARTMLSNQAATAKLVQAALNISAERAEMIMNNPELMTNKEAMEIGLKAMKAQDSRIHAVGKLREDNREQEKFERAFTDAAFAG